MKTDFEIQLEKLINEYSMENDSDTPDFILAKYLNECLKNFNTIINDRENYYGRGNVDSDLLDYKFDILKDTTGNPPPIYPSTTNLIK